MNQCSMCALISTSFTSGITKTVYVYVHDNVDDDEDVYVDVYVVVDADGFWELRSRRH